ncbi:MAG: 2-amino-4-hydroxy-6-hydroxymethyldihydropteridine diphosphokinase [Gammaproteobacteria bacterium]|nr:2-amino-4-hydroxy-6-hydroxymethyldihydropteridine diphosphokinase [Gammaproteobacteria bacterium]
MHLAYIGIGSNLDNPRKQIKKAIIALKQLSQDGTIDCSAIYQSSPMTKIPDCKTDTCNNNQQPDYLNAVVCINTSLEPLVLLDTLQQIENQQGRIRNEERWIARTLDLDLLLFDNQIINHPRLTIPHYGLKQRHFVIYPLADLDASLVLPDGTTIKELLETCSSEGIRKID